MNPTDEAFARIQAQVYQTFLEEASEGIERLEQQLLHLRDGAPLELVGELFRVVHTIKGNAGGFGLATMVGLAHRMEAYLDVLRGGVAASSDGVEALLEGTDALRVLLDAGPGAPPEPYEPLRARLEFAAAGGVEGAHEETSTAAPHVVRLTVAPAADMLTFGLDPSMLIGEVARFGPLEIRCEAAALPSLAELDPDRIYLTWVLLVETIEPPENVAGMFDIAGDSCVVTAAIVEGVTVTPPPPLVAPKGSEGEPDAAGIGEEPAETPPAAPSAASSGAPGVRATLAAAPPGSTAPRPAAPAPEPRVPPAPAGFGSLRISVDKLDSVMNLVDELVILSSALAEGDPDAVGRPPPSRRHRDRLVRLTRITRSLNEAVLRMRSLPIGQIFNRFPRMIHDISARLGKEVRLELRGEGTELDKTLMERLGDPMIHLVRNSLDHGLETPEDRLAAGKPRTGVLTLSAEQRGDHVVIQVSDDGRGLHCDRILARARARGLVAPDARLTDAEIQRLILAPGFSTAEQVTDLSGRGVGMDVVHTTIRDFGGELSVSSVAGQGTTITLRVPLTMAVIEGQLVRFAGQIWVLPVPTILECVSIEAGRFTAVPGRAPVYELHDQSVPVLDLRRGLGLDADGPPGGLLLVLDAAGREVGVLVEQVLGRRQVVVKRLEQHAARVPGLSGATILGDGSVVFIIDASALPDLCPALELADLVTAPPRAA